MVSCEGGHLEILTKRMGVESNGCSVNKLSFFTNNRGLQATLRSESEIFNGGGQGEGEGVRSWNQRHGPQGQIFVHPGSPNYAFQFT